MAGRLSSIQGMIGRRVGWKQHLVPDPRLAVSSPEHRQPELEDSFGDESLPCHRDVLALRWLNGQGLEIGALHCPVAIPESASVRYVDYKSLEENRARYPELHDSPIVNTVIIDDGFILRSIVPASVDFIVANHALEHSPNPFGTLRQWGSKLARGGVLYVTVPIADACYDRGRPITSLEHFSTDDEVFRQGDISRVLNVTMEHLIEFMTISDRQLRNINGMPQRSWREIMRAAEALMADLEAGIEAALSGREAIPDSPTEDSIGDLLTTCHVRHLNRAYDLHYHTFSPRSYRAFLGRFGEVEGFRVEDYRKSGSNECIGILRKL